MDDGMAVNVPYLLAQYLFRHVEGRKRGARLSGRYFVRRFAEHFGLRICERLGDTWALVVSGPERQQVVAVRAPKDVEGAHAEVKGVQTNPTPVQAPQPPPATAQPRTMPKRMARLEEEVHGIRESLDKQREVVDKMAKGFSRFTM
ncbi:retrovirus-related pol polyprotein from transposon TNT 1-94 [Tanacetum coccineum]